MTPILRAEGLRREAGGKTLVDVPAFEALAGERIALIGPNGAGKTTLLLLLAAILPPTAGRVSFRGVEVGRGARSLAYRRSIGVVFQEPLLFDDTVAGNVGAGLRIRGVPKAETARRVESALDRLAIAHLAGRSALTLSGGEAQRASLARAFAVDPGILFLDEPFSSLDPPTREGLIDDVEQSIRATGTTVVFSTHDRNEALRLADRIVVMNEGRIAQCGPPGEVMNRPADGFVASFVGVETVLEGTVAAASGGLFTAHVSGGDGGTRPVEAVGDVRTGDRVLLCIRPEDVTLSLPSSGGAPSSIRNAFAGTVVKSTPHGPVRRLVVDCGFLLSALVTSHAAEELALVPGRAVVGSVKATAIHAIRR